MRSELFFLSVFERFALMICDGRKQWEFRENPAFGHDGEHVLRPGDRILIVASCDEPYVRCCALVEEILRGAELDAYFNEVAAGKWLESGAPSVEYFRKEILGRYKVAVRLTAEPLESPVGVARIVRKSTGKQWSGRGFCHVSSLKRYQIDGMDVAEFFA